jgi:hypothetical protein
MGQTARVLLGEPNAHLSKATELRFGTHGSMSLDLEKGTFYDHENMVGGGVLDLVTREIGGSHVDAVEWLKQQGILVEAPKLNGKGRDERAGDDLAKAEQITVAEFLYADEIGNVVFAVERREFRNPDGTFVLSKDGKHEKTFRQKRPNPEDADQWIYDKKGCPVLPYRLSELTEAIATGHTIYVVEGEAKADLLWSWGVPATCCAGGSGKWKAQHSVFLTDADVVLLPDADDAGAKHIQSVGAALAGIAKRLRVLMLPGLPPKGDVIDWAKAGGAREQLDALVDKAPPWVPLEKSDAKTELKTAAKTREDELIAALAAMEPGIAFARARKEAASEFNVNINDIDAEIRRFREDQAAAPLYGHWEVIPWPEPVEGDSLLRDIIRRLRRQVVFRSRDDDPLAIALWLMFSWVHDDGRDPLTNTDNHQSRKRVREKHRFGPDGALDAALHLGGRDYRSRTLPLD